MDQHQNVVFEINLDRETVLVHKSGPWADALEHKLGTEYNFDVVVQRIVSLYFDPADRERFLEVANLNFIRNAFSDSTPLFSIEVRIKKPGTFAYEWYRVTVIAPIGGKCNGTMQNIQNEKVENLRLRQRAEHDALTDLLNRTAFNTAIGDYLNGAVQLGAFLIADIDNLKTINDTHGHTRGDQTILQATQKLRSVLPPEALVCRFGGDEFVVFLPAVVGTDEALFFHQTQRICEEITKPHKDDLCTVSVGVALFPENGKSSSDLLSRADRALYTVKQAEKGTYAFYDPSMPAVSGRGNRFAAKTLRSPKERSRLTRATLALLMGALIIAAVTFGYHRTQKQVVRAESLRYLDEISDQISLCAVRTLDSYTSQMDVLSSDLEHFSPDFTLPQLCEVLKDDAAKIGCDQIAAVNDSKVWYTAQHQMVNSGFSDELDACIETQKASMSSTVSISGQDFLLIFAPVDYTTSDGIHIGALVGYLRVDRISEALDLCAYDGRGHTDVVDRDGQVVIQSDRSSLFPVHSNLYLQLSDLSFTDNYSYGQFRRLFSSGHSSSASAIINGEEFIFYFSPLEFQDWMLLVSIPASVLEYNGYAYMRVALLACLCGVLVLCVLLGALSLLVSRHRNHRRKRRSAEKNVLQKTK